MDCATEHDGKIEAAISKATMVGGPKYNTFDRAAKKLLGGVSVVPDYNHSD